MSKRLTYKRKHYSDIEIGILTGLVEGEGSIYIGNFSCNPKTRLPYYQTNLQITNTSYEMIKWIEDTFGGLVNKRTPKQHAHNSRKQCYIWTATGDRLTHLCELMLPYAMGKKREIEIMLEMRATYTSNGASKGNQGVKKLPIEILYKREKLMNELRSLHIRTHSYKKNGHLPRIAISQCET